MHRYGVQMAVGRRAGLALAVGACLLAGSCSGQAGDPTTSAPTPTPSSSSATPTPSPSNPDVHNYALTAASYLNVAGQPDSLRADGGTLSVEESGSSLRLSATAVGPSTKKKVVKILWSVSLVLSSAGRTVSGTLTIGSQQWDVLANTGTFTNTVDEHVAKISTIRAMTINQGDADTNTPVTLQLVGASSKQ